MWRTDLSSTTLDEHATNLHPNSMKSDNDDDNDNLHPNSMESDNDDGDDNDNHSGVWRQD